MCVAGLARAQGRARAVRGRALSAELPCAELRAIDDPGVLAVRLPNGDDVCLVRCGDHVAAFRDECPHNGMPLSSGTVLGRCVLECAWHGARFQADSGALVQGPAEEGLVAYRVTVREGRVFVGERLT